MQAYILSVKRNIISDENPRPRQDQSRPL